MRHMVKVTESKTAHGEKIQERYTIDVDTVSKMGVSQDLSTVGDC